jgi:DnaJ-class molecular chaperone
MHKRASLLRIAGTPYTSASDKWRGGNQRFPVERTCLPDEQAFRVLGLNANASPGEISAAYRHLAQMYHPDKVAGLAPEFQILADKRMKEINAAYEALK